VEIEETDEEVVSAIVDEHMKNMLADLQELGLDAVGVAGGVVLATDAGPSKCHVFYMIEPTVAVTKDGKTTQAGLGVTFLGDVAASMVRSKERMS
jgi:hypothetical protein